MIANSPASGEQVFEFVGIHVAIAIVAGVAKVARFAQLPDYDFHMSRNAVFFVDGDCKLVQVGEGFVIRDGIDPGFVVFPGHIVRAMFFSSVLDSILVGDSGDYLGDEVAVFGLIFSQKVVQRMKLSRKSRALGQVFAPYV